MIQNYGWDLVYACSTDYINQQLAADPSSCIQDFNVSIPNSGSAVQAEANGMFGPWEMVSGGYGRVLRFKVPIKQGTLLIKVGQSKSIKLDGVELLIEAQLQISAGPTYKLTFDNSLAGVKMPDISIVDLSTAGTALASANQADTAIAHELLTQVLCTNVHQLTFEFASFTAPTSGTNAQLLAATQLSYAYSDMPGGAGGLALLMNLKPNPALGDMFDPALLGSGNFGFLASTSSVLSHCFIPALEKAFSGSTSASFELNSPTSISLRSPLTLRAVSSMYGYVYPKLTALSLAVGLNTYTLTARSKSVVLSACDIQITAHKTDGINFDAAQQCIGNVSGSATQFSTLSHNGASFTNLFLNSAAKIKSMEVAMEAEFGSIINALESSLQQLLGTECTNSIEWCGQNNPSLTAGGVNGNFFLQGNLS